MKQYSVWIFTATSSIIFHGNIIMHIIILMLYNNVHNYVTNVGPPLWSCGQSSWLQFQRSRVRFPVLPDFLRSSGSGTGSTQPREDN
jgi:hypothetical protein